MQDGKLLAFFSEKLKGSMIKYSAYDKELYELMRLLSH